MFLVIICINNLRQSRYLKYYRNNLEQIIIYEWSKSITFYSNKKINTCKHSHIHPICTQISKYSIYRYTNCDNISFSRMGKIILYIRVSEMQLLLHLPKTLKKMSNL